MAPEAAKSIKLTSAILDTDHVDDEEVLIVRGVVDPLSLEGLKVDDYQRERLSPNTIGKIKEGVKARAVPDIVLGMRGDTVLERGDFMYLQDPVYIIDGLQRVSAAIELLGEVGAIPPRLGAKIHLNTTTRFEKGLFERLNVDQTKVSPNILLRNRTAEMPSLAALFDLSHDRGFIMKGKISWAQHMARADLITAVTYLKAVANLHSHAGPGRANASFEIATGLDKIMEQVGKKTLVENTRVFFETIDRCWGIGVVHYRHFATYLNTGFLIQLARVFSDHPVFWSGDLLQVDSSTIKKLKSFPISDPSVKSLATSTGGVSGELMYKLLVDHINSGRRTNRLVARRALRDRPASENGNGSEAQSHEEQ